MNKYIAYRKENQDYLGASAGCIFKNPRHTSAGRLIDLCGLKGKRVGCARVSLKHANFIINEGGAKAADVLRLMNIIKKEVKNKFKLSLKPEIKIWQ
jgi:UDP-N-acetylmuramate dehydrogenase